MPASTYVTFFFLAIASFAIVTHRTYRGGWIGLLLAGQACALQLVWAGPGIRLQMFQGWGELLRGPRAIFFAVVLLHAAVVAWAAWQRRAAWRAYLAPLFTWPRALIFFALYVYSATTIAPEFAQALAAGNWKQLAAKLAMHGSKVALGLLIFGAGALNLALIADSTSEEVWQRWRTRWRNRNTRTLPWLAAAWVLVVSSLLAWFVLERVPHVPDELAYTFQANYFAQGKLGVAPPPLTAAADDPRGERDPFFIPFTLVENGRWYAATPAGWPAALAVGTFFGVPWLVNPLLGALAILLAHAFVKKIYDADLADGAALLLAASPWLLWMSANLMPHALTLVLSLTALLGVAHARESGSLWGGLAAGFGAGALLHVRPLEAIVIAGVAGVWWLAAGRGKLRVAPMAAAAVAGLAMTALFLQYNRALTGSATNVPINHYLEKIYYPGANRLGFGADVGNFGWVGLDALPGHGPIDVFMNTNQNAYLVNFEMLGWACGSLLLVFALAMWPRRSDEHRSSDRLMWWLALGTVAALNLYWFSGGADYGARYWYQVIVPLVVLTLRGAQEFSARTANARIWLFVAYASIAGLLTVMPWRAADKYRHYRGTGTELQQLASAQNFGRSLVIIRGRPWPDFAEASPLNPAQITTQHDGPIFAREINATTTETLRAILSDRPVWIVEGPSVTGGGFRIAESPR